MRKRDAMVHIRVDVRPERQQRHAGAEVRQVLRAGSDDADDVESAVPRDERVVYSGRVDRWSREVNSYLQSDSPPNT
jgi:hypothetical protein